MSGYRTIQEHPVNVVNRAVIEPGRYIQVGKDIVATGYCTYPGEEWPRMF